MGLRADGWTVLDADRPDVVRLVLKYHYSHSAANTSVACHGIFDPDGHLRGGALWMPPTKLAAQTVLRDDWRSVLALSRLVLDEDCPEHSASFLLGRSMRMIHPRWRAFVTYADRAEGHTGTIYRATNWEDWGDVPAGDVWVNPMTGQQRGRKRGPRNLSVEEMRALGFERKKSAPKRKFVYRRR
jgi:hypothetical protein